MMYDFVLGSNVVPQPLTSALLAQSEEFPNPEWLYATGPWTCDDKMLLQTEVQLGYPMPPELRSWFQEIGVCRFPFGSQTAYASPNNILVPTHIPKLLQGTCKWMMAYTEIQADTMPFFERDVDLFLCLHPKSSNPNAVHWMWGNKICDSLVEFFERLIVDPDWFNSPK